MKHRKVLSACIGALALLAGLAAFRGGTGGRAEIAPAQALTGESTQPPAGRGARRAGVADGVRDALVAGSAGAEDAAPCPDSVLPAFWHYVARARATPPEQRADFVARPARSIETLPEKERRALGVLGLEGFELTFTYGARTLETDLAGSLMERWIECAREAGCAAELRDATLAFLAQEARFGLAAADRALIGLAASFVGHFTNDDEDLRVAFHALMPLVEAALDERPVDGMRAGWDHVRPLIAAIAAASRHGWGRERLLALLASPVIRDGHHAFSFLSYVTAGQAFDDWRPELSPLLRAPEPTLLWAAVEALRGFAARGIRQPGFGLSPETLLEVLPPELFRHADGLVRLATIELTVAFGEEPGRDALLALLADPGAPRAEILRFLSMAPGKLEPAHCLALLQDEDQELRHAAITALGNLAGRNEAPLDGLRALALHGEDPDLRRRSLSALARAEGPEVLEDLRLAARDVDESVQLEAVRQIGLWATPQPELLASIATDAARADDVRQRAFQEWTLAADDASLPAVFDAMYADASSDVMVQGYLWKAALAQASGDAGALAAWEELPVPSHLIERFAESALERAAARALPSAARATIQKRIQAEANELLRDARRRDFQHLEAGYSLMEQETRATRWLKRRFEVPLRIIRYLDAQSAPQR